MKILLVIFIATLIYSCKSSRRHSNAKPNLTNDVLIDNDDTLDFWVESSLAEKLNLSSLSKGVDSFEMRLWFHDDVERQRLIIVKSSSEEWLLSETNFWITMRHDDTGRNGIYMFDVDSSKTKKLRPIAKKIFVDSLIYYSRILPNAKELNKTIIGFRDGSRRILEVATKNSYRFIPYDCGTVTVKSAMLDTLMQFLRFLSSQLSLDIPVCTR